MNKKVKLLIVLLVFVLLLGGASVLYSRLGQEMTPEQLAVTQTQPAEPAGTETAATEPDRVAAPDFTVYDEEGNEVRLSDYYGKPVVVNFWASWCGPCQMEMPDFQEKYLELADQVHFLMINMTDGSRETVETASAFIQEQGYTFPVFYDTDGIAAYFYGVYALPTTFFIDAEGNAVAQATSAISAQTLQQGIDMVS